ncbi:MAG: hypothetical protein IT294_14150 [Deltaproteobacteria bacterium]|nr:hypothetical protein [Deltaproteobacteria bacterium]
MIPEPTETIEIELLPGDGYAPGLSSKLWIALEDEVRKSPRRSRAVDLVRNAGQVLGPGDGDQRPRRSAAACAPSRTLRDIAHPP